MVLGVYLQTLHALLINIICASFTHISLTFYVAILFQFIQGLDGHFMFSILQRFFP